MLERVKYLATLAYQTWLTPSGPFFTEKDYPDLTGQRWLVTGATAGLGTEVAKILIRQNAELWIVGRSKEKLDNTIQELKKVNATVPVHPVLIDYSDLTTVKPAVVLLKTQTSHLDGIIHNAGVMNVPKGSRTKQDLELTVGVNNVATQLLQNLLDPLIENTPNGRIVWLSSLAHVGAPTGGFSVKDIATGSSATLYNVSKATNIIQSIQWSLKHPNSKVKSLSVHPGVIRTELYKTTPTWKVLMAKAVFYDVKDGAHPIIFAALSPEAVNNDYIVPFGRPGLIRPDILRAAHGPEGEAALEWIEDKLKPYR